MYLETKFIDSGATILKQFPIPKAKREKRN
jgi:hypothetical protein